MSFGGPGGLQKASKPIPPERGSFPLEFVPPLSLPFAIPNSICFDANFAVLYLQSRR
ncbi:MAG: hypothetical protein Q9226_009299, partial [Calogaya cf. arnoldii]